MTIRSYRVASATQLNGFVWNGASNSIANSATPANMTIPANYGKNNRNLNNDQNDFNYTARLVSTSLGWIAPVEALWGGGRMLDGNPSTGPHLSPAEICAVGLADLGIANVGMIVNAEGGAGIADYASAGAGADAKAWFDARVADAPLPFFHRALVGEFGFPDMASGISAADVPDNLDTWEARYRTSGLPGSESFLTFIFDQHNAFVDRQFYRDVRDNTRLWVSRDPRRFLITTADLLNLGRQRISVGPPPGYPTDPHWIQQIVQRGECASRTIFNALTRTIR